MIHRFAAFTIFGLSVAVASLNGVQTQSVLHETYADFAEGELSNLSLHRDGRLRLAPAVNEIASLIDPVIWSSVFGPDGELFVAAGNEGKVYRISADGEVSELVKTEEVFVRALAIGKDGRLYLGSSPDGNVYRIDNDGKLEIFFEPRETYIWALVFNDGGDLFVATGDKARIYRIPAGSEGDRVGEIFFESEETHISTLAWDPEGRLLAGTAPSGHVYRVEGRRDAFLLFNSGSEEIRQIVADDSGDLFVAAFQGSGSSSGAVAGAVAAMSAGSETETSSESESVRSNSSGNGQQPGVLHRVDLDGFHEPHWALGGVSIYSLLLKDGRLLLGSGENGRIFSVENLRSWELRQRLPAGSEVSVLLEDPEGDAVIALTSNPARIYRLDFGVPEKGEFLSNVFDAKQIANWGRFHVDAKNEVEDGWEISVRTGNSEKPNSAWSEWKEIGAEFQPARYLQYRLVLADPETEVRRVRFFYRHRNAAPTVSAIRVVAGGFGIEQYELPPQQPPVDLEQLFRGTAKFLSGGESRQQLRSYERPGAITIAWQARDPDEDELRFSVGLRQMEKEEWKILGRDLDESFLSIDGNGLKEGYYQVKVIASDQRSNRPDEAREGERVSERFLIDQSAPEIEVVNLEKTETGATVTFSASDAWSIITDAEMILNGGEPRKIFPEDGLFDSQEKKFRIEMKNLEPGRHTLFIRVSDELGNIRVEPVAIEIDSR